MKAIAALLVVVAAGSCAGGGGGGEGSAPQTEDGLRQSQDAFLDGFLERDVSSTYAYLTAECKDDVSRTDWSDMLFTSISRFEEFLDIEVEDMEIGEVEAEVLDDGLGRTKAPILVDGEPLEDLDNWSEWQYEDGGWRTDDCEPLRDPPEEDPTESSSDVGSEEDPASGGEPEVDAPADDAAGDDDAAVEPEPCPDFSAPPVERVTEFEGPPAQCLEEGSDYTAVISTSRGEVRVALDVDLAPETSNNFAVLAGNGYYDGTQLFRTDPSIDIIQGGSPHTEGPSDPGPGYTIADEGDGYTYQPGDLMMARSSRPNSASAQFFFAAGPNVSYLDADPAVPGTGTYVRFGRVVDGLDVLEAILASHVADPSSPLGGYPEPAVIIESVRIVAS